MDLAVGGGVLKLIFTLVVAIKASASKAKQNKEDCLQIARRVATLQHAIADKAYKLAAARHPDVLEDLRLALCVALEAVRGCQGSGYGVLFRLINAARVSDELRKVNRVVADRITDVVLVTTMYTNTLVYIMHQQHMEHLRIQNHIMMHHHHMEHDRSHRPLPQMQVQHGYRNTHNDQSLSNQSYAIQAASPSIPDQRATSSSIPCQIEWRAAVPDDAAFRREARESNIEPRVVVLLVLVLLLLGTRCGLERLLLLYVWRLLFRLG